MALDTAVGMNEMDSNVTTAVGTVPQMYEGIAAQLDTVVRSLPPVTLGDLLALLFHDFDNEQGLAVTGGRVYGDAHLDEANPANTSRGRSPRTQASRALTISVDPAWMQGEVVGLARDERDDTCSRTIAGPRFGPAYLCYVLRRGVAGLSQGMGP